MLVPSVLYEQELKKLMAEHWYDPRYQYYFDGTARNNGYLCPQNRCDDSAWSIREFVSVDNGKVVGFFRYMFSDMTNSCCNFGLCSFDFGNRTFIEDVLLGFYDIFYTYNFNRIEFLCVSDNPAVDLYRKFISRYGGREVGTFRQVTKCLDGKIHDCIVFEVLKNDLNADKIEKIVNRIRQKRSKT